MNEKNLSGVPAHGTAVVSGAARGIGLDIARSLSASGRRVVLLDVLPEVHDAAKGLGPRAMAVQLDLTDEVAVAAAIKRVRDTCGDISVLVNNAGISGRKGDNKTPVEEMDPADWDRVIETNLTSAFLLCRACIPFMAEQQWGRIVNMSSQAARTRTERSNAHYAASKSALLGFSRALAMEVAGQGITVNCVAPGRITTPMTVQTGTAVDQAYSARAAVGHVGKPADITAAVQYLISDDAGFMTGATVDVNGGYSMN